MKVEPVLQVGNVLKYKLDIMKFEKIQTLKIIKGLIR
jgi:hypothetical protein